MLHETPPATNGAPTWQIEQAIVFDWHDGPREGVARFASPRMDAQFCLLAERATADGLDERLYRLWSLPPGSIDQIMRAIEPLGRPTETVWTPVWKFPTETIRTATQYEIDSVLTRRQPTDLVVLSQDMTKVLNAWHVNSTLEGADLFSHLSV